MADVDDAGQPPAEPGGGGDFVASRKEFIQSFFKRASEFTEELLRENERLRFRILELETELSARPASEQGSSPAASALHQLVLRIEDLEQERERLVARFRSVERDNADFDQRFKDIERENNSLANLYVASFQLHSTRDLDELRQTIGEILINLVGARTFAVLIHDEQRDLLRPFAAQGIERADVPAVRPGEGKIGHAVASGVPDIGHAHHGPVELDNPPVVVPMRIKDRIVGAIVVWDFFPQKAIVEEVDLELFNLLAAHAANAMQGATLAANHRDQPAPPLWAALDA